MEVDRKTAAAQFMNLLGLPTAPVAVSFRATAPSGVPRHGGRTVRLQLLEGAAEGQTFYTEASDHYGCPIGAHTHGIDLPPAQAQELGSVVATMVQLGYIRSEEVAGIPERADDFHFAVYAPFGEARGEPDVVLVRGNAKQMMLLTEAAGAAGAGASSGLMGRPTCAAIPEVIRSGHAVGSLACIGNRVYTDLPDDEFYLALPGKNIGTVAEKLAGILKANQALESYHRARAG